MHALMSPDLPNLLVENGVFPSRASDPCPHGAESKETDEWPVK